jgi:hypothetical protein
MHHQKGIHVKCASKRVSTRNARAKDVFERNANKRREINASNDVYVRTYLKMSF